MKKAIISIGALFGIFLIIKLGFAQGSFAFLLSSFLIALLIHFYDHYRTLKAYEGKYNNIFVLSRHPMTGDELSLGFLEQYVIHAEFSKVMVEVEKQKDLLQKAGNPFFLEGLTDKQRLQVIPIIFQSGLHVAENWEEYHIRVVHAIKANLSSRHEYLKKQDPSWYSKYSDGQVRI